MGGREGEPRRRWVTALNIAWRLLLVVVGVPAVWILRAMHVVDLSFWQALAASVVLVAIAVGDAFWAAVLST